MTALDDALAYLDRHINYEKAAVRHAHPTLDRMQNLCALLGDPHKDYPAIHVTGTNGKGSTVRIIAAVLEAHGLNVGMYTSPHLERINERMAWNQQSIGDDDLAANLLAVQAAETDELTHFEVLTAAAFRWFADIAVDVAVVEVGLGGRWDSTNVIDGVVAVVTNIGLDHAEVIGPTTREIAIEKAGIIKPGSTAIIGPMEDELRGLFPPGDDFACVRNVRGVGGRVLDIQTERGLIEELFLPLHGPHQGDNAAAALAAVEAFFGRQLDEETVRAAFEHVTVPGRFEVIRSQPYVVLDGAHNPDGARALRRTLDEQGWTPDALVVGFTAGRDPEEMLEIIGPARETVIHCRPNHPRALPADYSVEQAVNEAMTHKSVLVTGSLYVVGDARKALQR